MSRDRGATEQRLITAVGDILESEGFAAVGVNSIAREAGVDKVLIYRYFGGLSGLLQAFGERGDFWPVDEELLGNDPAALLDLPPASRWARVAANAVAGLRHRPLAVEVLAGELAERSELTAILERVREDQYGRLAALIGEPNGRHARAAALAVAAGSYLLIRARHIDIYAGIRLDDSSAWDDIETLLAAMIASLSE